MTNPTPLEAAFEVRFDPDMLRRALTHRSFAYENGGLPTNERLEFLGDAVLGLVITATLFRNHPDLAEGQLAKLRASVVNMRALADVARRSARTASAHTCCSARARRPPADGTRPASWPTRSRRSSARSTSSTAWTRATGRPQAVRPADGRGRPARRRARLEDQPAGAHRRRGLGVPEYRIDEAAPTTPSGSPPGCRGQAPLRRRAGRQQEGGRAAGCGGGLAGAVRVDPWRRATMMPR